MAEKGEMMMDKRKAYPCYSREQDVDSCDTCYWDRQENNKEVCEQCKTAAPACGQDCKKCAWIGVKEGMERYGKAKETGTGSDRD